MSSARLRNRKKEKASSQNEGTMPVLAPPPRMRKVYSSARVTMSTISRRFRYSE
ncbi:hypothetical protein D3C72_2452660 [compost metagenome]